MKIVNILGGLGNQMFQYAFLVALRETSGVETCYDASVFKTYPLHNGFELDRLFTITARQASKDEIKKLTYYTSSYSFWRLINHLPKRKTQISESAISLYSPSLLSNPGDYYYTGYWQDARFFDRFKDILRQEFTWKKPLEGKNQDLWNELVSSPSISVHVRRGDYLGDWRYKGICGLDYYERAISQALNLLDSTQSRFVLFSDDIPWCKDHIVPLFQSHPYSIIDWNIGDAAWNDMRLMSACRINIIANSSFSWWAAYLNEHPDSRVIAPARWTNAKTQAVRQLEKWILID